MNYIYSCIETNIHGNHTPDYDICTRNKERNIKTRQILEANEMNVLRKIVGKTKVDRIRSQQIRESSGIQPINEWAERRRKENGNCKKNGCREIS